MLDALAGVPAELTVSQCFRFEDPKRAIKYIRAMESHHRALSKTLKTYIREILTREESGQANRQRLALSAEASEAAGDMGLGRVKFGWHNLTVLVYGHSQDAAEQNVQMAANALRRMGFVTIRERFHLLPAYAGTLPGQWMEPVRWHFLGTDNIADFAPIRAFFEGETTNPHYSTQSGRIESCLTVLPTEQATPFYFNFHQGDVGHTLVVGPTGSGKSVFCNFLMAQFRKYDPGFVFIFDKNQSCKIPTLLQGGTHIDLTGGHDIMLNPMALVGRKESWSWLAGWLEILLTSRGHQLSSDDEREVWKSIESISVLSPDLWRLRTLASFLPRHLQTELDPWIGDGPLARFFDNPQDTFDLGDFTCVEMSRVLDNPRTGLARAFMEYAFYRIDEKLDGRPALIYLEEAWFLMADERFAAKIEDWLKTLRKKNALVIMTTQSLDDVSRAGIAASILDNVKTRIFLPNPNAEAYRDLYQRGFGLLPGQVDRIREAMPKREYYIQTETVSRLVQVTFDAPLLAYLRSDVRAQRLFEQHRQSGDPQWQQRYLKDAASI
jgi:type IV secretion system protein VirB4